MADWFAAVRYGIRVGLEAYRRARAHHARRNNLHTPF